MPEVRYVVTAKIAGLLGYLHPDGQFHMDRIGATKLTRDEARAQIESLSLGTDVRLDMDPDLPDY